MAPWEAPLPLGEGWGEGHEPGRTFHVEHAPPGEQRRAPPRAREPEQRRSTQRTSHENRALEGTARAPRPKSRSPGPLAPTTAPLPHPTRARSTFHVEHPKKVPPASSRAAADRTPIASPEEHVPRGTCLGQKASHPASDSGRPPLPHPRASRIHRSTWNTSCGGSSAASRNASGASPSQPPGGPFHVEHLPAPKASSEPLQTPAPPIPRTAAGPARSTWNSSGPRASHPHPASQPGPPLLLPRRGPTFHVEHPRGTAQPPAEPPVLPPNPGKAFHVEHGSPRQTSPASLQARTRPGSRAPRRASAPRVPRGTPPPERRPSTSRAPARAPHPSHLEWVRCFTWNVLAKALQPPVAPDLVRPSPASGRTFHVEHPLARRASPSPLQAQDPLEDPALRTPPRLRTFHVKHPRPEGPPFRGQSPLAGASARFMDRPVLRLSPLPLGESRGRGSSAACSSPRPASRHAPARKTLTLTRFQRERGCVRGHPSGAPVGADASHGGHVPRGTVLAPECPTPALPHALVPPGTGTASLAEAFPLPEAPSSGEVRLRVPPVTPFHVEHAASGESPSHRSPSSRNGLSVSRRPCSTWNVLPPAEGPALPASRGSTRAEARRCLAVMPESSPRSSVPSFPAPPTRVFHVEQAKGLAVSSLVTNRGASYGPSTSPCPVEHPRASRAPVLLRGHEALRGRCLQVESTVSPPVLAPPPSGGPPPAPPRPGETHPVQQEVHRRDCSERGDPNAGPTPRSRALLSAPGPSGTRRRTAAAAAPSATPTASPTCPPPAPGSPPPASPAGPGSPGTHSPATLPSPPSPGCPGRTADRTASTSDAAPTPAASHPGCAARTAAAAPRTAAYPRTSPPSPTRARTAPAPPWAPPTSRTATPPPSPPAAASASPPPPAATTSLPRRSPPSPPTSTPPPPAAAPPASSRHPPPAPTPAPSAATGPSAPCPPSPASPTTRTLPTTARTSAGTTIGNEMNGPRES
ncbi:heat shock protein DnaJ domain protein [Archangium gephyra]|uniref:Heat shock protein DnaJ domain protein n=1 Tax=Archangium gephyra TaxID=48 RepID=A0AAC8Q0M1_9BACT|nr:heat shock protein DnaJ domain protein [Archangium gephyra]